MINTYTDLLKNIVYGIGMFIFNVRIELGKGYIGVKYERSRYNRKHLNKL